MQSRRPFLFAALVLSLGGCQPAAPAALTDADRTAIETQEQSFARWARSHALDSLVNGYYTEDAVLLAPNAAAATGRASILALLNGYPPFSDFQIKTVEINGAGSSAWVRGNYTMVMAPPGAAPIPDSGKFLEVWQKQADGSWRCMRDAFNSDLPLPTPAPAGPPPKKP